MLNGLPDEANGEPVETAVVVLRVQVATVEEDVVRVVLIADGRRPVVAVASDIAHADAVTIAGSGKENGSRRFHINPGIRCARGGSSTVGHTVERAGAWSNGAV